MSSKENPKNIFVRLRDEMHSLLAVAQPRIRLANACTGLMPDFSLVGVRSRMYQAAGCDIGAHVAIMGRLHFVGVGPLAQRLHVGDETLIAPEVTFGLDAPITIGKKASIGPRVTFHTASHGLGFGSRRMRPSVVPREIVIEDGVWLGAHVVVLPGVRVGRGSVASAGAVLSESVPPNSLVAGNPAVVKETLAFGER